MKKTLLQLTLALAGVAAVSVAQAQPAPAPPAPGSPTPPAPTTTADPNAPPAPSAAPTAPAPTTTAPAPTDAPPPAGTAAPQGDPNAPPPPPPVAPPPPATATPPAAAPPTPFVPPPPPPVTWNTQSPDGGDTAAPTEKPKPLRWRGTAFNWYQYANTQYFGVGADYIGKESFGYIHIYRFTPRFYIVDEPKDKLQIGATVWGGVELTTSTAQQQNEFEWRDTALSLKYTRTLLQSPSAEGEAPEWLTKASLGAGATIPTSKGSFNRGLYTTLSAVLGADQQVKLLGTKSDWVPNLTLSGTMTYWHALTKTNIPVSGGIHIRGQDFAGRPLDQDVASTATWITDHLIAGIALDLPIYKDLSFGATYRYWMKWRGAVKGTDCDVQLATGCVAAGGLDNPNTFIPDTILDLSISYNFFDVVDAGIGYSNWTSVFGNDGKTNTQVHNQAYSTDATFYLDLTANLDAIYSKATGRDKKATAKGASGSSWF